MRRSPSPFLTAQLDLIRPGDFSPLTNYFSQDEQALVLKSVREPGKRVFLHLPIKLMRSIIKASHVAAGLTRPFIMSGYPSVGRLHSLDRKQLIVPVVLNEQR